MKQTTCFALAVLCVVGCTRHSAPPPAGAPASTSEPSTESNWTDNSQSFGDFSFSIPSEWTAVAPDRDKTKAMLLLGGTTVQNAKAMIKVDVGKPVAPTAKQLAESFAKSAGGNVLSDTLDFDGVPGVIALTSSNELVTPKNMIVIYRGDKAYLLMAAAATAGIDVGDAVTHIRESWKWKQSESK